MRILIAVLFGILIAATLPGQENLPPWILLEEGKILFAEKKYGDALEYFNEALGQNTQFPDALYWIALSLHASGEYILAEDRYLEAIENGRYLYNLDDIYQIKKDLARLYIETNRLDEYERVLLEVVYTEIYPDETTTRREGNIVNMIKADGIDDLLFYYRLPLMQAEKCMGDLGVYYYKKRDYQAALVKSLYAALSVFSRGIDYFRLSNPDLVFSRTIDDLFENHPLYPLFRIQEDFELHGYEYAFSYDETTDVYGNRDEFESALGEMKEIDPYYWISGAGYMIDEFQNDPALSQYLLEADFFRSLYYLGASLFALGFDERAREVLTLLRYRPVAGEWYRRSRAQLRQPFIDNEPIY